MTKPITGYEMARARRDVIRIQPESVQVYRATRTADGKGGWTSVYALFTQGTGRIQPLDAKGQVQYATKLGASRGYVVTIDFGVGIGFEDRIRMQGLLLEIIAGADNMPTEVAQRLICREVGA